MSGYASSMRARVSDLRSLVIGDVPQRIHNTGPRVPDTRARIGEHDVHGSAFGPRVSTMCARVSSMRIPVSRIRAPTCPIAWSSISDTRPRIADTEGHEVDV
jgi:hypothetical protein